MPKFPVVELQGQPAGGIELPKASGDVFGTNIGTALQNFGSGIEQAGDVIEKRVAQDDISQKGAEFAGLQNTYTQKYQEATQKGYTKEQFAELDQQFDDDLGKIRETSSSRAGQLYYDRMAPELKTHFVKTSIAGQAELAAVQAKQNYIQFEGNLSSALYSDPSGYDIALKQQDTQIQALVLSGGLPAEKATELKTMGLRNLTESTVRGWIQLNPAETQKQLLDGRWDSALTGDLKKQLIGESDQEIRGRRIEEDRQRVDYKRRVEEQQEITKTKFIDALTNNNLSTPDILQSNLTAAEKEHYLNLLNSSLSPTKRQDPMIFNDVFSRIHLPDGDPNKIINDADLINYVGKGISVQDLKFLRKEVQGVGSQEGKRREQSTKRIRDEARTALVLPSGLSGVRDPDGEANYTAFIYAFDEEYARQKQAGKSDAQLLNPKSPDFLGKMINNYVRSPQEIIKSYTKNVKAGTPPTTPKPRPTKPIGDALEEIFKEGK